MQRETGPKRRMRMRNDPFFSFHAIQKATVKMFMNLPAFGVHISSFILFNFKETVHFSLNLDERCSCFAHINAPSFVCVCVARERNEFENISKHWPDFISRFLLWLIFHFVSERDKQRQTINVNRLIIFTKNWNFYLALARVNFSNKTNIEFSSRIESFHRCEFSCRYCMNLIYFCEFAEAIASQMSFVCEILFPSAVHCAHENR